MADKKKGDASGETVVCRNRKALHEFEILERVEAGIILTGTEVKSLRTGKASLENAYARLDNGELWLLQAEIPEYAMGNRMNHEPKRKRKLMLHRRELAKFAAGAQERGFTLVPLRLYFKGSWAKVEVALAKGKKLYDKRESLKEKTAKRDMLRAVGTRRSSR